MRPNGRRRRSPSWQPIMELGDVERRLRCLDEISKLLLNFEKVEHAVRGVAAALGHMLGLRSAIFILDRPLGPLMVVWRSDAESVQELKAAASHVRTMYRYFAGAEYGFGATQSEHPDGASSRNNRFVVLPLVASNQPVFGALQLEMATRLIELDLLLANAVGTELAIAVARSGELATRAAVARRRTTAAEQRFEAAEASRMELERRFELAAAVTASLGEGVLAIDLDHRVAFYNRAAAQLLGWADRNMVGARIEELVRVRRPGASPAPLDEVPPWARAMRDGSPAQSDEDLFSRLDGSFFSVSYTATPLTLADRASGAVLVFRDIMPQKEAERRDRFLVEAGSLLGSTLEDPGAFPTLAQRAVPAVADLCVIHRADEAGELVQIAEAHTTDPTEWFQAADVRSAATLQARALAAGRPLIAHDDEETLLLSAGLRSMIVVPLRARETTLGLLTMATVRSNRRYSPADLRFAEVLGQRVSLAIDNARLYQAARRALAAREHVLAAVSHDLKNPIGVILMGAAILAASPPVRRSPTLDRAASTVARSAERMKRLVADLLDVARIEAGNLLIESSRNPVAPLIRDALQMLRPMIDQKSLHVGVQLDDAGNCDVLCDRDRILQVFSNLIGNAIKFTRPGGSIQIRAEVHSTEVWFAVADSGQGISREELPLVFDRFWQAKKTARAGTGLGLSIVKGIVTAHGGRVWAESELGVGSTFIFTLPVYEAARDPLIEKPSA
jgi:PAS domain S-box-containing protein